ncbi:MAG: hypothetical protein ABFQ82_02505 [Thermodesulfobacteriota bacterium]
MRETTRTAILTGIMAIGLTALMSGSALAEEKPEAGLTMGAYSQYVWRGYAFSDSSVVIQPSMTVAYKGFGVNLWGNLDTDYDDGTSKGINWNETDMTISYDGSAGKIGYGIGWIYYNLGSELGADSQEVYAGVSVDTLLAPTLTIYNDIDNFRGYYATLGISHSIPVAEGLTLDLGAQIGYYDLDDTNYSEFHDGLVSAAMTFAINDYVSVTPELYYSFALTNEAEADIIAVSSDGDDDHIYGGVSASFAF